MDVTVTSHRIEIEKAAEEAIERALEAIGIQCESHAKANVNAAGRSRHGASGLQGHITHQVVDSEKAVYVGSNLEYAVYNEVGTGIYAEGGGGRKGWWVYVAGESKRNNNGKTYSYDEAKRVVAILKSRGLDAHMTQGMKPIHFLKKAVEEHVDEYKKIVEEQLKNG